MAKSSFFPPEKKFFLADKFFLLADKFFFLAEKFFLLAGKDFEPKSPACISVLLPDFSIFECKKRAFFACFMSNVVLYLC